MEPNRNLRSDEAQIATRNMLIQANRDADNKTTGFTAYVRLATQDGKTVVRKITTDQTDIKSVVEGVETLRNLAMELSKNDIDQYFAKGARFRAKSLSLGGTSGLLGIEVERNNQWYDATSTRVVDTGMVASFQSKDIHRKNPWIFSLDKTSEAAPGTKSRLMRWLNMPDPTGKIATSNKKMIEQMANFWGEVVDSEDFGKSPQYGEWISDRLKYWNAEPSRALDIPELNHLIEGELSSQDDLETVQSDITEDLEAFHSKLNTELETGVDPTTLAPLQKRVDLLKSQLHAIRLVQTALQVQEQAIEGCEQLALDLTQAGNQINQAIVIAERSRKRIAELRSEVSRARQELELPNLQKGDRQEQRDIIKKAEKEIKEQQEIIATTTLARDVLKQRSEWLYEYTRARSMVAENAKLDRAIGEAQSALTRPQWPFNKEGESKASARLKYRDQLQDSLSQLKVNRPGWRQQVEREIESIEPSNLDPLPPLFEEEE